MTEQTLWGTPAEPVKADTRRCKINSAKRGKNATVAALLKTHAPCMVSETGTALSVLGEMLRRHKAEVGRGILLHHLRDLGYQCTQETNKYHGDGCVGGWIMRHFRPRIRASGLPMSPVVRYSRAPGLEISAIRARQRSGRSRCSMTSHMTVTSMGSPTWELAAVTKSSVWMVTPNRSQPDRAA